MNVESMLLAGWSTLESMCPNEYGLSIQDIIKDQDESLIFRRVGRLMAVSIKRPFAQCHPYDPSLPTNWARSRRFWEIEGPAAAEVIERHRAEFELLMGVANEWNRPAEFIAEFNIFHSLCKRLRPVICEEAKALKDAEKIAKDLQKDGAKVALLTPNHVLGAAAVTVAGYLIECHPFLSAHAPIVAGATLLAICFGHRKMCAQLAEFEKSYTREMDSFADRAFAVCGSFSTNDGRPCANRVRINGTRCWIHS